jgi:hypothetical protein
LPLLNLAERFVTAGRHKAAAERIIKRIRGFFILYLLGFSGFVLYPHPFHTI